MLNKWTLFKKQFFQCLPSPLIFKVSIQIYLKNKTTLVKSKLGLEIFQYPFLYTNEQISTPYSMAQLTS